MRTLARPRDKAEILRRLRALRPDSSRRWGRMSAHQMVCHLGDAFRLVTHRKPASPATGRLQQTVIKWLALYVPLPWPADVSTRPEMDQEIGGTKPADFVSDVAELETLLDLFTARAIDTDVAHPIFGRMSQAAWLRWGYLHMDHHLRQFGL